MRQIKFRGKLINSDEWLYGGYYQASTGEHRIITVDVGTRSFGAWHQVERDIEVIGNIYDNPEILKGGEE